MGYSFSEESLSVGAVVDDSSLRSSVNRKLVSGRMPIKMQVLFSVIEQDMQLQVAEMGGVACVNQHF